MSTAQAAQTSSTKNSTPATGDFITSGDVDKMDATMLAAEIKNGRTLSITGRKLAELRGILPH